MSLDDLIGGLPGYAKDLKLNYSSLVRQNTELTTAQLWGTVVATAIATRSEELTAAVIAQALPQLSTAAEREMREGRIFLAADVLISNSGIKRTKYKRGETSKR